MAALFVVLNMICIMPDVSAYFIQRVGKEKMFSRVFSGNITGVDASIVRVEADVSGGLPQFNMVGLLSSEIREAKERVERAFLNSGFELPARKITVNLSPASIRKQGSGFDVPIAVAILTSLGLIKEEALKNKLFIGELSLDGHINKVCGVLPVALLAQKEGINTVVVPMDNVFEGSAIENLNVYGVSNLKELVECLNKNAFTKMDHIDLEQALEESYTAGDTDYLDIRGQDQAKRATEVAVAGFHNLMYVGPPGSGKSMMARRIPTILNRLSKEECLEISKIYSVMGLLPDKSLVLTRPFRSPHHSITAPALVGGMGNPRPGEITLAHKGILFLDEAAEFKKNVIEMLRQPLEDRQVVISRMAGNMVFPADFMLVLASNPCPCGYYPDRQHCMCSQADINRYFGKLKGPILDRIDICVGTTKLQVGEFAITKGLSSEQMRANIMKAQKIQEERFKNCDFKFNSQMGRKEIERFCVIDEEARKLLDNAYEKYNMTARGYYKIIKVSRTIADLDGTENINKRHILEAIGYRNMHE